MSLHEVGLGAERQVLLAQLDQLRGVVLTKVAGLDDDQLQVVLGAFDYVLGWAAFPLGKCRGLVDEPSDCAGAATPALA